MVFRQLFDRESCTYTYVLADGAEAVVIDPVKELVDRDAKLLGELGLTLRWICETHCHADHITGAAGLRDRCGGRAVASVASQIAADRKVVDGEELGFGGRFLRVRATPGHTAGCVTYVLDGDPAMAFTGDALLIRGCGRTDFQEGDSAQLYASVWSQILALPEDTLLWPGHDYLGRTVTTVREERAHNPRLGVGKTPEQFAAIMAGLNLAYPKRIDEAVPANLRLGA